jgi:hypothetical protein
VLRAEFINAARRRPPTSARTVNRSIGQRHQEPRALLPQGNQRMNEAEMTRPNGRSKNVPGRILKDQIREWSSDFGSGELRSGSLFLLIFAANLAVARVVSRLLVCKLAKDASQGQGGRPPGSRSGKPG